MIIISYTVKSCNPYNYRSLVANFIRSSLNLRASSAIGGSKSIAYTLMFFYGKRIGK